MPGSGKTTIGKILANLLGWTFADCDYLIEALYGARLQDITDSLGKNAFLDAEGEVIKTFTASSCVIATGGSAIYRPEAIQNLRAMGPLVYLKTPPEIILERISLNPERGIALGPGETVEVLFEQRLPLYENAADFTCDTGGCSPEECALAIRDFTREYDGKITPQKARKERK